MIALQGMGARVLFIALGPDVRALGPTPVVHLRPSWDARTHPQRLEQKAQVRFALENTTSPYLMKADDDTEVNATALRDAMACFAGGALMGSCRLWPYEAREFCGGGSAYVYSRESLLRAGGCLLGDEYAGAAEDVAMSWCMLDSGADLLNHPGFHFDNISDTPFVTRHHVTSK